MLGINCIKLICVYLHISPNTVPKIEQKLGGQLDIRVEGEVWKTKKKYKK